MRKVLEILIANIRTHLSDEALSDLVSGELAGGKLRKAQFHLSKCWKCRSRHEQLERAAMGFVEFHKQIITPNPPEASEWREMFLARLDKAAAEVPSSSWSRLLPNFRFAGFTNMNPFLASAAVILVASVILFFIWQRSMPSVSASELMQRAESAESNSAQSGKPGVIYQKVQIRTPHGSVERDVYRDREGRRRPKTQPVGAEFTPLKAKLNIAGVNWDEPLSAASYKAWHDSQSEESDQVRRSGKNLLTVTTKTSGGIVAEESLTVREGDFHPVKRTVELLDVGTVEIAEVNYVVLNWNAVNTDLFEPLTPAFPVNPSIRADFVPVGPAVPTPAQLLDAELQARVALHTVGADLGEQVEVIHGSHALAVVVRGLANTPGRKQELVAALQGIPNLEVRLRTVDEAIAERQVEETAPPTREVAVSGHPALEERLVERFPNVEERSAFVDRALALFDQALAHAWALRHLEERYTPDQVGLLSQSDRQTLELLMRDHVATIRQGISDGDQFLEPFLVRAPTTPVNPGGPPTKEDWRKFVHEMFQSVQEIQADVAKLLAGSGDTQNDPEALSRDFEESLIRAQAQLSVLSDHVSGPSLSNRPSGAVPGQHETSTNKQEKP
jgi:hypothetical protein